MKQLTLAPIEEKGVMITVKTADLGKLAKNYVNYYVTFFRESILNSYYSTTSQSFINLTWSRKDKEKFKADIIQVFASKSSIRTIHSILTISGIACIDIVAADTISSLYQDLGKEIKATALENGDLPFIADPFNFPNASNIIRILGQIGAISKYRQLLRDTIPREQAVGIYEFLSPDITPETDTILVSRIKGRSVMKTARLEYFPILIGCLFCSPFMESVRYNLEHDAFFHNVHLIALALDNIVGVIVSQDTSFRVDEFYTSIVQQVYRGILIGKENIKRKTVQHWNTSIFLLILDHFAKTSHYLDYTILEPVLPYKLIRSIYTRVLAKKKYK
jgi:hypothetical protein